MAKLLVNSKNYEAFAYKLDPRSLALSLRLEQIFAQRIRAQVWPSVPGCILFGSIPGRHRLTPDPTNITRDYSWLVNWIRAQGSSFRCGFGSLAWLRSGLHPWVCSAFAHYYYSLLTWPQIRFCQFFNYLSSRLICLPDTLTMKRKRIRAQVYSVKYIHTKPSASIII